MRKLILSVALGGCAFFGLVDSVRAAEGSGNDAAEAAAAALVPVDVQEVSGLLDEIQADAIEKALVRSGDAGSQALILQVNTRGAVISRERMSDLLANIAAADVPVAIWVGPSGSRLYGMAAQMLAAADVTAMAPGSRIGRMGTPVTAEGVTFDFGSSTDLLQTETLGFADARKTGALKFASNDEGVPVLKNMVFALDGLKVDGTTLDTVAESLDGSGQVVREATTVPVPCSHVSVLPSCRCAVSRWQRSSSGWSHSQSTFKSACRVSGPRSAWFSTRSVRCSSFVTSTAPRFGRRGSPCSSASAVLR